MFIVDIEAFRILALVLMSGTMIALLSFWKRWKFRGGPDFWMLGIIAYFVAFFLSMFQDLVPQIVLSVTREFCIVFSSLCFLHGIRTMMGRTNYLSVEASVLAITFMVSLIANLRYPFSPAGAAFNELIAGNVSIFSAVTLFRSRDFQVISTRSASMALFLFFGFHHFSFILLAITVEPFMALNMLDGILVFSGIFVSVLAISLIVAADSITEGYRRRQDEQNDSGEMLPVIDNKWLLALEYAKAGSWELNLETGSIDVSQQWRKLLGYSESNDFKTLDDYLNLVHPDDRDNLLLDRYAMNRRASDIFRNQHRMRSHDGTWLWVQSYGRKTSAGNSGKPILIITDTDINEQKANELIMKQAVAEAEMANRSKSAFIASLSHEIRTPMNSILGFTQVMLEDDAIPAKHKESLDIIYKSGQHLLELIDDILDLSKLEIGRAEIQKGIVDLPELLNDVTSIFQQRESREAVSFEMSLDPDLPRFIVTDSGKIRQICTNLLSNAFKFTQKGKVRLLARGERTKANLYSLQISVIDTGPGIPDEEKPKVFSFFGQAGVSKRTGDSHGLGLIISKNLAKFLGGDITFTSEAGKGSHFKLTVPVKLHDETESYGDSIKESQPEEKVSPPQEFSLQGAKILIIEDDNDNRELLARMLTPSGFELRKAESGNEGLQILGSWKPDLVLMDIQMPGLTGDSVISEIRHSPEWKQIPVIALTGNNTEAEKNRLLDLGANDFLAKPFSRLVMLDKINALLSGSTGGDATPGPATKRKDGATAGAARDSLPRNS